MSQRSPHPPMKTSLETFADRIRRIILEQSYRAHVGHIGSALSIADIMAAIYGGALNDHPGDRPAQDRFVLSKGHAALALYACLFLKGRISQQALDTYCGDGSLLGVHPEHQVAGIDFCTGSLGMGISMAGGAALAAKLQHSARRVFVVLSDAECNEGVVWESAMFAAHHRLSNLIAVVDCNGQQAFGYTKDVMDLSPLERRWEAFGWDVTTADGHNVNALQATIDALDVHAGPPHVIVAHTTFGKGVSFMEGQIKWHYWPLTEAEYRQALKEIS